jgi:hypothetical protein
MYIIFTAKYAVKIQLLHRNTLFASTFFAGQLVLCCVQAAFIPVSVDDCLSKGVFRVVVWSVCGVIPRLFFGRVI